MDTMIELPAMRRTAELAPNTADTTARTVEVVWSAGARVRRATFFGEPYDEELSLDPAHVRLDRLNAGAPFLKVHELDKLDAVIGSVVPGSARIENGRGIALVRISERADVEPIWRDIQAGHIRAVSIGYQVHRFEVSKPEAARELWRAVDWTPFEVSAVAVGADPAAGFRAHRRGRRGGGERRGRHHRPGAAERDVLMSAFAAAVGALFADPNIGRDAIYIADGGTPVLVRAVARRADAITDFGDARLWSETTRIDLRVAEVPNPRPGDRIEIDGDAFLIQGEPVRDRERLVWTVDLRPA